MTKRPTASIKTVFNRQRVAAEKIARDELHAALAVIEKFGKTSLCIEILVGDKATEQRLLKAIRSPKVRVVTLQEQAQRQWLYANSEHIKSLMVSMRKFLIRLSRWELPLRFHYSKLEGSNKDVPPEMQLSKIREFWKGRAIDYLEGTQQEARLWGLEPTPKTFRGPSGTLGHGMKEKDIPLTAEAAMATYLEGRRQK